MDLMHEEFAIDVSIADGTRVVVVFGEVDLAVSDRLRESLLVGDEDLVVDLTRVSFLDSSGIAVLLRAHRRQVTNGHQFALRGANGAVSRVLEITGVYELLPRAS